MVIPPFLNSILQFLNKKPKIKEIYKWICTSKNIIKIDLEEQNVYTFCLDKDNWICIHWNREGINVDIPKPQGGDKIKIKCIKDGIKAEIYLSKDKK